jgi:hypothetical protein
MDSSSKRSLWFCRTETISAGKAWALGGGIVLVVNGAWFISLWVNKFSEVLMFFLWSAPAVAAFVTAYLSPRKKVLLGVSIAPLAVILVCTLNFAYQAFGHAVDFHGIRGGIILATITMVFDGVLCAIGATCGYLLTRKPVSKTGVNLE